MVKGVKVFFLWIAEQREKREKSFLKVLGFLYLYQYVILDMTDKTKPTNEMLFIYKKKKSPFMWNNKFR